MAVIESPRIKIEKEGTDFKVLKVSGEEGMKMPLHHNTKKTIVVCLRGGAVLYMDDKVHELTVGNHLIIPAGVDHSLTTQADFQALVIMDLKSTIIFQNN